MSIEWTNGSWTVRGNGDYVFIDGPFDQSAVLCGGDFEGLLEALCSAYSEGRNIK